MKNKNVFIALIVVGTIIVVFGVLACLGLFRGFDAQRYVQAVLDQTFKGETKDAELMMEDVTAEQLLAQYEGGIASFAKKNVLNGIEVEDAVEKKCIDSCRKIFAGMKYEAQEAKERKDQVFEVPVTFRSSDVYLKYMEGLKSEGEKLKQKMENGEYEGESVEEVKAQMEKELLESTCTLLEKAYKDMEFGEEETMVFTVKKGENGLYSIPEDEIATFILKIMNLDAKED